MLQVQIGQKDTSTKPADLSDCCADWRASLAVAEDSNSCAFDSDL